MEAVVDSVQEVLVVIEAVDDGFGDIVENPLAAIAFVSGERVLNCLGCCLEALPVSENMYTVFWRKICCQVVRAGFDVQSAFSALGGGRVDVI